MKTRFLTENSVTPIQYVEYRNPEGKRVPLWVKRDDLIHPSISGNKWRKLKYSIMHAKAQGFEGIVSFGGAFSNHIAALAAAGKLVGMKTIGLIRTHEIDFNNPTLKQARDNGMQLIAVSRLEYKQRNDPSYLTKIATRHPNYFVVPEGGSNALAPLGLGELAKEIQADVSANVQLNGKVDYIACAIGSGGTIQGLLEALPNQPFIGELVVNDAELIKQLSGLYLQEHPQEDSQEHLHNNLRRLTLSSHSICGGYGKVNKELVSFCDDFYKQTNIPIEPIYTGKLFYSLCHYSKQLGIKTTDKVLAIHTGGLQGIKGLIYNNKIKATELNF